MTHTKFRKKLNLSGKQIGNILVLQEVPLDPLDKNRHTRWLCKCGNCLNLFITRGSSIKYIKTCRKCYRPNPPVYITHGKSTHPLYTAYYNMLDRCYNPNNNNYKNYGCRGITVCDRWRTSFENFFYDMIKLWLPGKSIHRVDNDKGYYKENCIWTDAKVQNTYKRKIKGSNHPFSKLDEEKVKNIKQLLRLGSKKSEIAKKFSISHATITGIAKGKSWKHVD